MVDDIYTLLNDCIENHLNAMVNYDVGSDEMKQAITDVAVLYKLRVEDERNELEKERMHTDRDDKTGHAELEGKRFGLEEKKLELERERMAMENDIQNRRDNLDKNKIKLDTIISAAEIVLPLTLYGILSYIGFAREFDGVVSSDTLKRVLNSIKTKR